MFSKTKTETEEQWRSLMTSLPEEVVVDIIARVPRCYYPTLSLVSRRFRSLVVSPYLYARRSSLACTEPCIYVVLSNQYTKEYRLYFLHRTSNNNNNNRLVLISSIPHMSPLGSFVPLGSKIYVVGEYYGFEFTSNALAIDCTSHTLRSIPNSPNPVAGTVADIIDGKIYVIGYCPSLSSLSKRVMVFDTETQMWEPETIKPDMEIGHGWCGSSVVMADKMYMTNSKDSFIYRPIENKWETDEMLNSKEWKSACVVDDILYYYDHGKSKLRAYDPKHRCWRVVKGVGSLVSGTSSWMSHTAVSYGGKLVVFLPKEEALGTSKTIQIWCAEIALEKQQGGEIWGKVERCDVVIDGCFHLIKSLVVVL